MIEAFDITKTWLECISCGHKADLLAERKFLCEKCGGFFDVKYDFESLAFSFDSLKNVFKERLSGGYNDKNAMSHSGVWRYKELIMPYLPKEDIVTLSEGNVSIVHAGKKLSKWIGGDIDLWLILEGMTPTDLFK